jgi:DNA polymerase-3 subunit gamma/tau
VSLALYRTYRPGRFADVVGQAHVTTPLMRALARRQVHHAYLFSGPRGCGKTSSARILARSLNCDAGPTPEPCGECESCIQLAPNGPGSLDVIEIDAATHGLVDDARELRQQAHFSPTSSRFKIYIIDEAHQLGPGAANALLKIIEEPPAHLKFVFATTAADKILGTIRSRTHHYPFRLVPAGVLQDHLAWVCEQEGIQAEPEALALVTRAAGGSVRDALSVLGQLAAGAGEDGIDRDGAVALLGFTDDALLDRIVDGLVRHDGEQLFAATDDVLESGHDPRRFLTDLLEHLRDLILLEAAPSAAGSGLVTASTDRAEAMQQQARTIGQDSLLRLVGTVEEGLTRMKGATPTRLQLELVVARLLLDPGGAAPLPTPGPSTPEAATQPAAWARERPDATAGRESPSAGASSSQRRADSSSQGDEAAAGAVPMGGDTERTSDAASADASESLGHVRSMWPEVLQRLREIRRVPWTFISQNSEVVDVGDHVLTLGMSNPRLRDQLVGREDFLGPLLQAVGDVLGGTWRVEAVVSGVARSEPPPRQATRSTTSRQRRGGSTASTPAVGGADGEDTPAVEPGHQPGDAATSDEDASMEDQVTDELSGEELLSRELGAEVIDVAQRS